MNKLRNNCEAMFVVLDLDSAAYTDTPTLMSLNPAAYTDTPTLRVSELYSIVYINIDRVYTAIPILY